MTFICSVAVISSHSLLYSRTCHLGRTMQIQVLSSRSHVFIRTYYFLFPWRQETHLASKPFCKKQSLISHGVVSQLEKVVGITQINGLSMCNRQKTPVSLGRMPENFYSEDACMYFLELFDCGIYKFNPTFSIA